MKHPVFTVEAIVKITETHRDGEYTMWSSDFHHSQTDIEMGTFPALSEARKLASVVRTKLRGLAGIELKDDAR